MSGWVILQATEKFIAQLLIETQSLKIEGIQIGMLATTPVCFAFSSLHQFSANPRPTQAFRHP